MAQLIMAEGTTPATPSTGKATIFINANGILCWVDDAGNVYATAPNNQAVTFTGAMTINKLILGAGANLTIAAGAITVTHSRHLVDTGGGATEDLNTISGGTAGQVLAIGTVNSGRDVVLKHGTGNLLLDGGADFTLAFTRYRCVLLYDGTNWVEIGRSD